MEVGRRRIDMWKIAICCAAAIAIFMRLYKLTDIPYGIHIDEAGMGYDAWCLANYGVDRYLNSMPVYLINFGGGQSALYAYTCALLIKITGGHLSTLIMRLPAVIYSLAGYAAGVYVIRKLMGKMWSVAGAFLLAVMPYFVMQARFGLDCNLLVNMLTVSAALLIAALDHDKLRWYVAAGIAWGLTYYTYALSYVANTVILIVIIITVLIRHRDYFRKILVMLIPVVLLGAPLALMVFANMAELGNIQLGIFTIPELPTFRAGELGLTLDGIADKLKSVIRVVFCYDNFPYNSIARYTNLYKISVPFAAVGIIALAIDGINCVLKKPVAYADGGSTKMTDAYILRSMIWLLIFAVYFVLGLMLGGDGPNVNKLNGIYFAEFYLILYGIRAVYRVVGAVEGRLAGSNAAKWIYTGLIAGIYLTCAASFASYYFTEYAGDTCRMFLFSDSYGDLLAQLEADGMSGANIYTDTDYIYYCISEEVDPYELNIAQTGGASYKNITFTLPEEYEEGAVYIVSAENTDYREFLSRYVEERYTVGLFARLVCCY